MKIFNILGKNSEEYHSVGSRIAEELERRGYSVGVVSEEDYREFVSKTGSNSSEIERMLDFYKKDYLVIKGRCKVNCPHVLTAADTEEIREGRTDLTMVISGSFAEEFMMPAEFEGLPIINAFTLIGELVDYLEKNVPERMPNYPKEHCMACGTDCRGLTKRIIRGEATIDDCVLRGGDVQVIVGGKELTMVPFVKRMVRSVTTSVVKELDGYSDNEEIVIRVRPR